MHQLELELELELIDDVTPKKDEAITPLQKVDTGASSESAPNDLRDIPIQLELDLSLP